MQTMKNSLESCSESPSIREVLMDAKNLLSLVSDNPQLEAEVLLSHVLNAARSYLHAFADVKLSSQQSLAFEKCLLRRRHQEPIAYITGSREFWSLNLAVNSATLIPRPETELLVESVLAVAEEKSHLKIADLGTGSGAIALALAHEKPSWQIYATDESEAALQIAAANAKHLSLDNISFSRGNWCNALPCQEFDVIVSNPPYLSEMEWDTYAEGLAFEPRTALVSGLDGLDSIRTIIHSAKGYLRTQGQLFVEHGFLQGAAVRKIFSASGYGQIHSIRDLAGHERVTVAEYHP
jgi:release factor glutamine methyltransferase